MSRFILDLNKPPRAARLTSTISFLRPGLVGVMEQTCYSHRPPCWTRLNQDDRLPPHLPALPHPRVLPARPHLMLPPQASCLLRLQRPRHPLALTLLPRPLLHETLSMSVILLPLIYLLHYQTHCLLFMNSRVTPRHPVLVTALLLKPRPMLPLVSPPPLYLRWPHCHHPRIHHIYPQHRQL